VVYGVQSASRTRQNAKEWKLEAYRKVDMGRMVRQRLAKKGGW